MTKFHRIVLASRPRGAVVPENFRLEEVEVPVLAEGQLLVRNHYLSLDPYMRGRMSDAKSYAAPQPLEQTMIGGTVGEVVESRNAGFAVGDFVAGIPSPLAIGKLRTSGGTEVCGFLCEAIAAQDAIDITDCGGWRRYLARSQRSPADQK